LAVSAYHAQVYEDGRRVRDLHSTNGLLLDGQRVEDGAYAPGMTLQVGGYGLRWDQVRAGLAPEAEMEALAERLEKAGDPRLGDLALAWAEASPSSPKALLTLAAWQLKSGREDQADLALKRGLMMGGETPRALFLAAALAEQRGDLEQSWALLEEVEALAPGRPETAQASSRLAQKREVYAKVHQLVAADRNGAKAGREQEAVFTAGPFRIGFIPAVHGDLVLTTHAALAAAAEKLESVLGFTPTEVSVRLSKEPGGDWRAAAYQGEIELFAPEGQKPDPNFFLVALTHEYVHLAVDRLSRGAAPAWLTEGLAQYITQNQTPRDRALLEKARRTDAFLPLALLAAPFSHLEEKPLVDLAYAQAYSLVNFLASSHGLEGLRRLLAGFRESGDPEDALAGLGLTQASLEKNWRQWLA